MTWFYCIFNTEENQKMVWHETLQNCEIMTILITIHWANSTTASKPDGDEIEDINRSSKRVGGGQTSVQARPQHWLMEFAIHKNSSYCALYEQFYCNHFAYYYDMTLSAFQFIIIVFIHFIPFHSARLPFPFALSHFLRYFWMEELLWILNAAHHTAIRASVCICLNHFNNRQQRDFLFHFHNIINLHGWHSPQRNYRGIEFILTFWMICVANANNTDIHNTDFIWIHNSFVLCLCLMMLWCYGAGALSEIYWIFLLGIH